MIKHMMNDVMSNKPDIRSHIHIIMQMYQVGIEW